MIPLLAGDSPNASVPPRTTVQALSLGSRVSGSSRRPRMIRRDAAVFAARVAVRCLVVGVSSSGQRDRPTARPRRKTSRLGGRHLRADARRAPDRERPHALRPTQDHDRPAVQVHRRTMRSTSVSAYRPAWENYSHAAGRREVASVRERLADVGDSNSRPLRARLTCPSALSSVNAPGSQRDASVAIGLEGHAKRRNYR